MSSPDFFTNRKLQALDSEGAATILLLKLTVTVHIKVPGSSLRVKNSGELKLSSCGACQFFSSLARKSTFLLLHMS